MPNVQVLKERIRKRVRALGLRQSRYIGLQKASLQRSLVAAALAPKEAA
jgi:hypothetical protein